MNPESHRPTGGNRLDHAPGAFATTQWSLVACAGQSALDDGRAALERLCRLYWYPLYCFARRHCASPHDAADLTQGFFADLLERDGLSRANAARGRFRTFLLCSFKNFCSHERNRAGARKRGGGCHIVSIDATDDSSERAGTHLAGGETPEELFDRRWATSVIERALASVRAEYAALGKATLFDELQAVLKDEGDGEGYPAIAARLNAQAGAIKVAAFRLRRRLANQVRTEVAQTVASADEVDDEMRHLLAAIGR